VRANARTGRDAARSNSQAVGPATASYVSRSIDEVLN
jgi:hypothetical protein